MSLRRDPRGFGASYVEGGKKLTDLVEGTCLVEKNDSSFDFNKGIETFGYRNSPKYIASFSRIHVC
jgi:hypothetical protein